MNASERFHQAIQRFDHENERDPNRETADGVEHSRELLYARRLSEWVERLAPNASEPLRLAARCQHICRWEIPRSNYEMNRVGYLKWRADLKKFHAQKAGEILREIGYDEETVRRVQDLNLKKNFPADPDCRTLEDALCLMFLQFQLAELTARSDEEKLVNAVRNSWKKMTPAAQALALELPFAQHVKALIDRALQ